MTAPHRIELEQNLTIYHAADIKARLLGELAAHPTLELDLSHVGEVDTAGVQLLLLLKREAQRLGKEARIVNHSPAVLEVIDFLHLATRLGDPMVVPSEQSA